MRLTAPWGSVLQYKVNTLKVLIDRVVVLFPFVGSIVKRYCYRDANFAKKISSNLNRLTSDGSMDKYFGRGRVDKKLKLCLGGFLALNVKKIQNSRCYFKFGSRKVVL